jgi:uncharacterized membrane-anchored protein YjiN (DUF445 family)
LSVRCFSTGFSFAISQKGEAVEKQDEDMNKEYDEKRKFGIMSWKTCFDYFRVGGGVIGACINFIIFIVSQVLLVSADFWVSTW